MAIETPARRLMSASDARPRTLSSGRVTFRLADPERRYAAVRLCSDLPLSDAERSYRARRRRVGARSSSRRPSRGSSTTSRSPTADGATQTGPDPGNPLRAPGAFGEKSVLLLPGYEPPAWLDAPTVEGHYEDFSVRGRGLGANVTGRIWSPLTDEPLPLLVAHDGPEYDKLAMPHAATARAMIAAGTLPPHRVALLAPGPRDEWYSASALYSRALYVDVIPALPAIGAPVGMGASLGALAMLVTQRRAPGTFGALFLQSGSFFMPRFDCQESGFVRYARIVRVVRRILRATRAPAPDPRRS